MKSECQFIVTERRRNASGAQTERERSVEGGRGICLRHVYLCAYKLNYCTLCTVLSIPYAYDKPRSLQLFLTNGSRVLGLITRNVYRRLLNSGCII